MRSDGIFQRLTAVNAYMVGSKAIKDCLYKDNLNSEQRGKEPRCSLSQDFHTEKREKFLFIYCKILQNMIE